MSPTETPSPDFRAVAREIMETADVAYLSTIDPGGYPHTRAMFNLRNPAWFPKQAPLFRGHEEDFFVYLTTNTASWKIIEANGGVLSGRAVSPESGKSVRQYWIET